ncbi:unnamed protein product, partial [Mesorhabditis belari]|uniref:C-type lectin domain-containing protein n=1 Tax=Mesorhabditis belari TaxID=2138241 RepID=A0AAF3EHD0_9BILA
MNATNWSTASSYCRQKQGNLVSIHNTIQNNILAQLQRNITGFDAEFWLGATLSANGSWSWSDGTPFDYQQFQQPYDKGNVAVLDSRDRLWKIRELSVARNFFCEALVLTTTAQPVTSQPLVCLLVERQPLYNCKNGWQYSPDTGYQYLVIYDTSSTKAQAACQAQGAQLASIHSQAENDFITGLCCENGCDFTAHDHMTYGWYLTGGFKQNGSYQWIDGTPFDFQGDICEDDGNGSMLIVYNYDTNCHRRNCGRGIWEFWSTFYQVPPYVVCKKK